jgi:hypothetical protein
LKSPQWVGITFNGVDFSIPQLELNSNSIERKLIGIGNQPNYGSSIMKKAHVKFPFSYSCKWID